MAITWPILVSELNQGLIKCLPNKRKNEGIPIIIVSHKVRVHKYIKNFDFFKIQNSKSQHFFFFLCECIFHCIHVCLCVCNQGSIRAARALRGESVNAGESSSFSHWERWMKFIEHVTVNTPSREKTLQWINKCWLCQPPLPVIYTPQSTFLLRMNYGKKWLCCYDHYECHPLDIYWAVFLQLL